MRQDDIRPLGGIRGIAACFVMLYHFGSGMVGGPLIKHGYLSVDLFFVLSGFVMALSYARSFENAAFLRTFGEFLGKRLARVYPLYILMTGVMGVCLLLGLDPLAPDISGHVAVANVFMVQSWLIGTSIDEPAWSISTEFMAYLLFPVLLPIAARGKAPAQIATAALCIAAVFAISMLPTASVRAAGFVGPERHGLLNIWDGATPWPVIRCLAEFTLGLLGWRLWQSRWMDTRVTAGATTGAAILTLVIWCIPGADVLTVAAFAVLVPVLAFRRGAAAHALSTSVPHALGEWSYAIYLIHPLIMLLIQPAAQMMERYGIPHGWTIAIVLAIPITLTISWIVHHSFEKPARAWTRRVLSPRKPNFV